MATRSSYLLAVLLIANPFMLLAFQNCSANPQNRAVASTQVQKEKPAVPEYAKKVNAKLLIK